jgi:hypothetical protein
LDIKNRTSLSISEVVPVEGLKVWRYGSTILNLGVRWYVIGQLHDPATSVPREEHLVTIELEAGFATLPFWMLRKTQNFSVRGKEP